MRFIYSLLVLSILVVSSCQDDNFIDLAAQAEEDEMLIQEYLEDNQIDAQRHSSGLYYRVEEEGSGGSPNLSHEVRVKYQGYLLNGNVFDETPEDDTRFFFLSSVIRAWQIGIPLLEKGGKGTFYVPSNLGYSYREQPNIPANSVLIFEVELIDFD
ncbi:MAG: FKBP-type peptidyl-prolyl cis-trans isomerase [Chitinophagales bacterium]|nr:FKBP-type peptidyl-prolyl cis-trans isomerase [Chitinophagales bacterium]